MDLPGITLVESSIRMPLMDLPVRTVVVDLPNGKVVISPFPGFTARPEAKAIANSVSEIVAPNLFHHLGIPEAVKFYPKARLWGVDGFPTKRPDVWWREVLTPETWPYNAELKCHILHGMPRVNEAVFLHRPSRTLIACDLCFNIRGRSGLGARFILGLFGTWNRFGVSRFFLRFATDREALKKSLARVLDEDFENIVMGHGEVIRGNGRSILATALAERGLA